MYTREGKVEGRKEEEKGWRRNEIKIDKRR